jgi:hypothetical protein
MAFLCQVCSWAYSKLLIQGFELEWIEVFKNHPERLIQTIIYVFYS